MTPIVLHGARHCYAELALAAGVRLDIVSPTAGSRVDRDHGEPPDA